MMWREKKKQDKHYSVTEKQNKTWKPSSSFSFSEIWNSLRDLKYDRSESFPNLQIMLSSNCHNFCDYRKFKPKNLANSSIIWIQISVGFYSFSPGSKIHVFKVRLPCHVEKLQQTQWNFLWPYKIEGPKRAVCISKCLIQCLIITWRNQCTF